MGDVARGRSGQDVSVRARRRGERLRGGAAAARRVRQELQHGRARAHRAGLPAVRVHGRHPAVLLLHLCVEVPGAAAAQRDGAGAQRAPRPRPRARPRAGPPAPPHASR